MQRRTLRRGTRAAAALLAVGLITTACGGSDPVVEGTSEPEAMASTEPDAMASTEPDAGETTEPSSDARVGLVYDIGGRGDQSFNDSAAAGLDRAASTFGLETKDLEPTGGGEDREELLRLLSDDGFPLVFAVGFAFADGVTAVSGEFTDTNYAIIDSVVDAPNVASLTFAEEQGSYLVGAAAALQSETGMLGFIGGVETDLIKKFEAGFVAGAESINPDVVVDVKYISQPPDFSGFGDPAKGKEIALGQFGAGADVVYHAAGGSGSGLFEAAKETSEGGDSKVWAIGVDSDQALTAADDVKEYILTSMIKRVDVAVENTITDFIENGSVSGVSVFDLSVDGVGYSTTGGFIDAYVDQLEELKAKIISGEITVPSAP